MTICPGLSEGDYVSSEGCLPIWKGQGLDGAVIWKFRSRPKERIPVNDGRRIADAFVKKNVGSMKEMITNYPDCKDLGAVISRDKKVRR